MRSPRLLAAITALLVTTLAGGVYLVERGGASGAAPSPVAVRPTLPPALLGPLAEAAAGPTATAAGVQTALAGPLGAAALGGTVRGLVVDATTGAPLLSREAQTLVTPASTTKIMTGVAALDTLPADLRIATRVVRGSRPDELVLVGGGDPTVTSSPAPPAAGDQTVPETGANADPARPASLVELAHRVAQARAGDPALAGMPVARLRVDTSLFSGPTLGPGWSDSYVPTGNVAPVTALAVDEGRVHPDRRARVDNPPVAAGEEFAALLREAGVPGELAVSPGIAAPGAPELARVESPPVPLLVEQMLQTSDNDLAEALARQVALRLSLPASFDGAARAVTQVVVALGVPEGGVRLVDGSGLSRNDRLSPEAVVTALRLAAAPAHPALRPLLSGLPVAGFSGTLDDRYRTGPQQQAAGDVRAKTGTLSGVSALAGLVVDADGRLLAFGLFADAVPVGGVDAAEAALDRLAAVLAACGCSSAEPGIGSGDGAGQ